MSNLVDSSSNNNALDALITFKNLPEADIQNALNIEQASYPSDEAASQNSLTFRQKNALECFRGAYINNELIGFICGTRTNDVRLTHNSMDEHVKDGKSLYYEIVCSNWPDAYDAKESIWIPHIKDTIGVDENSVVVGHSSGALCAMRLLETQKLKGVVLVSAAHTDLGSEHERLSGYFDRPWEFEKIKNKSEFIIQFHSTDDHLIPVQEARYVAEQLKGDTHIYHELEGKSHFFEPFDELIDVLKEKLLRKM
eukprot:g8100.t1